MEYKIQLNGWKAIAFMLFFGTLSVIGFIEVFIALPLMICGVIPLK